jgi:RHS repeat-associated protein
MAYSYTGNRLLSVAGLTGTYAYDANGNAVTDGRNGAALTYNHLNLPVTASKSGLDLAYTYDAVGRKLRKVSTAGTTVTTDYVDGIQYTNGTIDLIQTEQGMARNSGGSYTYEYNLTDHLGKVRASFDIYGGAVRMLQRDDYYAFGLRKSAVGGTNRYLYNGKELQEELGTYDYGARMYDPVIGRWNVVDPHAEKYEVVSPYVYGFNNPIRFIDIKGKDPGDIAILFSGADFGQGITPTTLQVANGVRQQMNGGTTITYSSVYYRNMDDGTQSAYDEIIKNNKMDPNGKVLLYGYSYGGTLANYLAKRLEKVGITVDIMVTVDAANGWGSDNVDRSIGENVKKNENYFETNVDFFSDPTKSHGGANKGKPGQVNNYNKSKDSYKGKKIDHMNIDDATVGAAVKALTSILNNMKDGEKRTLTNDEIKKLLN